MSCPKRIFWPAWITGGATGRRAAAAAARLADAGIRRLFVVADRKLVGVVSRRDLLSTFRRPDEEIRAVIERDILDGTLQVQPGQASVTVAGGVVTLLGLLDNHGSVERAGELAAEVQGMLEVKNRLDFVWDDHRLRPAVLGSRHPAMS
ncbi:BON domain-containing protein [Amycolatopsis sp. lyj-112]|uniref:BON domain-containing protein n=1 Tax=Amycolatopsis sp. lyj-112 TaxID=2789288 RepID=UPI003979DDAC